MHFPPIQSVHIFQGYNPFPKKEPPLEIPLSIFKAARQVNATHLSADGLIAYTMRYGKVLQADWDGARFGSWLDIGEEMPVGAVKMG